MIFLFYVTFCSEAMLELGNFAQKMCRKMCVCVSGYPRKKCCNFWAELLIITKFQGCPNSSQVIFWWVQTPRPTGQARTPKRGFYHIYLLPGFWSEGVVSYLIRIEMTGKKMLGAEFWFSAHGPRKMGQKSSQAGSATKVWNLDFFHGRDFCS